MCRIDAPYINITFEEKNDPKERFVQALDEFEIQGNFRTLLIKHYSDNWRNVFRGVTPLENFLDESKKYDSEQEKCIATLIFQKQNMSHSILNAMIQPKELVRYTPKMGIVEDTALVGFIKDVGSTYYPDSSYALFNALNDKAISYYYFINWLYGKDFSLSKQFFDDDSLNALGNHERTNVLWRYFEHISQPFTCLTDPNLTEELISVASSNVVSGPLSKDSFDILAGFDFIRAWIMFDSQSGRFASSWTDFLYDTRSPWHKIETLIRSELSENEDSSTLLNNWSDELKLEFEKLMYLSVDFNFYSTEDKEKWVEGLELYYKNYTNTHIYKNYSKSTTEDLNISLSSALKCLCSELTHLQISTWIKYSIDHDFKRVINSKKTRTNLLVSTEKWVCQEHFVAFSKIFLESLNNLVLEEQLLILSDRSPLKREHSKEFYAEFCTWWDDIFHRLVDPKDFPKRLIPDWTVAAIGRFKSEDVFPYIDNSIGILRGELLNEECDEKIKIYHGKLETLFKVLDQSSSRKALRHRLLLMRSSKEPFSDESISKLGSSFEPESFCKWYDSLKQLSDSLYAHQSNGNKELTIDTFKQFQNDFYLNFSHEIAEFCLSRLCLRKGEKATDGKYDSSQVTEQSSIWRQGYLKALTELGFDLNGKVHKTVNFTKNSDPNEDVRSIASECYKAVRRHTNKNPSIQDIKRSIIAAEWWLLMCQRHELGLLVNHEEALKTRRNLMRNP